VVADEGTREERRVCLLRYEPVRLPRLPPIERDGKRRRGVIGRDMQGVRCSGIPGGLVSRRTSRKGRIAQSQVHLSGTRYVYNTPDKQRLSILVMKGGVHIHEAIS
jgi:hypothetical protein